MEGDAVGTVVEPPGSPYNVAMHLVELIGTALFGVALVHTFSTKLLRHLAARHPRHAGLLHLLGEVEVVFGFWAIVFVALIGLTSGHAAAVEYVESRQYTEPLFVFVIMVVAASRPILSIVDRAVRFVAALTGQLAVLAQVFLCLAAVPLLGSFITEPAAMTLAALMLQPIVFRPTIPEWRKYLALGALFVNISVGGTLTSFAAPPVLMVADTWAWDSAFMAANFGWKAAITVILNASIGIAVLAPELRRNAGLSPGVAPVPFGISVIHLAFLGGVVAFAHHPVIFVGLFLLFLGFTQAYVRYQSELILREALLVAFFLSGLVVLGAVQRWWLQPLISTLSPTALFLGALALTAITDNAALTYLGSLIAGMSDAAKYMLVAGAVAGGGLTVIANAPNPAGMALVRKGFSDGSVGAGALLLGALLPTLVAASLFVL